MKNENKTQPESGAYVIIVGHTGSSLVGQYLQGPRSVQEVKRGGYGFTPNKAEAWTFTSARAALGKARIVDCHIGWGEGVLVTVPAMKDTEGSTLSPTASCTQCGMTPSEVHPQYMPVVFVYAELFGKPYLYAVRCNVCGRGVKAVGENAAITRWNNGLNDGVFTLPKVPV